MKLKDFNINVKKPNALLNVLTTSIQNFAK